MIGQSTTNQFLVLKAVGLLLVFGLILTMPVLVTAQTADEENDAVAIFNKAQDLHEKGDLKGAIALYEKALIERPDFPEAEYQRGSAYLSINDSASAEKAFRRAVVLRPGWSMAIKSLSSVLIRRGEVSEPSKLLQQILDKDPFDPAALTALTELRLRTKTTPDVLRDLLAKVTVVTSRANSSASLWTARAALEIGLSAYDGAKSSLGKALSMDASNALALSLLGDLSLANGDIDKAREISARVDKLHPQYEPGLVLKARVLVFDGRFDEAAALLATVRSELPGLSDLNNRINIARTTSAASLEALLKDNEKDPIILGRLCSMFRRDDPAKALDYCRRASAAEPDNLTHAIGFGAALVQARQFGSAVSILTKIIAVAPDNATARANLATALFQLKRYPEAKAEFRWLTQEHPDSAGAYYFLGILHDQLSEYLDAAASYRQYLKLADPATSKTDIERVNLRMPEIQRLIKEGKGKKAG